MFNYLGLDTEAPTAGFGASMAARASLKSMGIDPQDPMGVDGLTAQVMANLKSKGYEPSVDLVRQLSASVLKSTNGGRLVTKADDPVIVPQPYVSPIDFNGQYPIPLDPTEILTMCEEITTWFKSGSLLQ